MFDAWGEPVDDREPADLDDWRGSEPPMSESDWQELTDRGVAADEAFRASVALHVGSPAQLDEPALVEATVRAERSMNRSAARRAELIAAFTARQVSSPVFSADEYAECEFAAALGISTQAAGRLVGVAVELARRFPSTLDALRAGGLSWAKATALVEGCVGLADERAAAVEARVLPGAEGRTPGNHAAMVRRWVDRLDPDGIDTRRQQRLETVRVVRRHLGDGMGELVAELPGEQLDTVWQGVDLWARARKAAGDPRTLDQLRVAAIVAWAQSFLVHGDPTYCDLFCHTEQGHPTPGGDRLMPTPPTRQGKPGIVQTIWDVESFTGDADRPGESLDSGAVLPVSAMRELVAGGVSVRAMHVDPDSGELLALGEAIRIAPADLSRAHGLPVTINLVVPDGQGTPPPDEDLYQPSVQLAELVAMRSRHPANPGAGMSAAAAGDMDHVVPHDKGGATSVDNLHPPTRRWHRAKTHGGWRVARAGRNWQWTSPNGRTYTVKPYDYRLGP